MFLLFRVVAVLDLTAHENISLPGLYPSFVQNNASHKERQLIQEHKHDGREGIQTEPVDTIYGRHATETKGNSRSQRRQGDTKTHIINRVVDSICDW